METKDIKAIQRRVKRLNRVNVALGIIISFCEDLIFIKFKKPVSSLVYKTIISLLTELRYSVRKEREFLVQILDNNK